MALLSKEDVESALTRLGELALAKGQSVELLILGGTLMVIHFQTRAYTRDVDVVILSPSDTAPVREFARQVALEYGWPENWRTTRPRDLWSALVADRLFSLPLESARGVPPSNSFYRSNFVRGATTARGNPGRL
jgi:predicted nucleotidyltransferase